MHDHLFRHLDAFLESEGDLWEKGDPKPSSPK